MHTPAVRASTSRPWPRPQPPRPAGTAADVKGPKQPLLFLLHPPGGARTLILRAHSPAIKQAWLAALAGATAGPPGDAPLPTKPPPLGAAAEGDSEGAPEEGGGAAAGAAAVPRKISTRVFPEAAPAEEERDESWDAQEDGAERPAGAQREAAERELVAAIQAAAASRRPSPAEAALLATALPAVRSYVEGVGVRLQGLAQKTASAALLLGRREALYRSLLAAALLPSGAAPARLASADAA